MNEIQERRCYIRGYAKVRVLEIEVLMYKREPDNTSNRHTIHVAVIRKSISDVEIVGDIAKDRIHNLILTCFVSLLINIY
jgi:hypothetical protein